MCRFQGQKILFGFSSCFVIWVCKKHQGSAPGLSFPKPHVIDRHGLRIPPSVFRSFSAMFRYSHGDGVNTNELLTQDTPLNV